MGCGLLVSLEVSWSDSHRGRIRTALRHRGTPEEGGGREKRRKVGWERGREGGREEKREGGREKAGENE